MGPHRLHKKSSFANNLLLIAVNDSELLGEAARASGVKRSGSESHPCSKWARYRPRTELVRAVAGIPSGMNLPRAHVAVERSESPDAFGQSGLGDVVCF